MTPAGPICASCKQLGHSRGSNFSCPLNPRHKTLLIPQKRTSDNLSAQEEYQAEKINALSRAAQYPAESSRAAASRPRVEAVQSRVVLTIAEIIALSRAAQYPAESSRAAASRPRVEAVRDFVALQVSDVERVLDLTTTTATATATVIPRCSSCNGIGHQRSNSLQCPNNQRNRNFVPGQLTTTHNMARRTTASAMATIVTGSSAGKVVLIPRIKLNPTGSTMSIEFKRCQFPVRLAFAMTINKFQGQILDKVGLYLPDHVFGHGQLYVALSRVRTPNSVKIMVDMDSISTEATSNYGYFFSMQSRWGRRSTSYGVKITVPELLSA
ncbi:hypothetical protein PHYBLDRAFT_147308 [Phycomyces blakesleeanus NRRL 1555(-)]|uniref:ATP-dependent DNA helicase n=1 Tax=Phycomyces blakesleeanus (strain ATCC 8743b / DSM 1359 / FGSC 10004 / NBRC 33097 / NRRL 1555) TaxID=763407 RepID=A0A167M2A3_PHYB8|nr:hypothetical protein PHYBLDRAFT_147308 [Phycomyces blakesleeanus NRRL 1555(-)]OAD71567.1 hypothetical protein PHYBLDRAFT_147308 [Phycomyces blakesleeanus NRRL 1555(-)]|eukprot:XP_018289607.1 hypothetical protein PHYBLDRAFT_147308 [Phycomyces blakesleeanus NRRL 1555(-)]